MENALCIIGISAATLLLCTACINPGSTGDPNSQEPRPTATYTPSHSADGGPQAPVTDVPVNPAWLPGDKEAAKETAANAMTDFARPHMEKTQWANDFARWLTPQATTDYSGVDPANVPVTEVTAEAELDVDPANGFGATATVPTDVGPYTVQLLRQSQNDPWKVHRISPQASR